MHGPKAQYLLKRNVDALLKARGHTRKELAAYCRRSEGWISKIFSDEERNLPLKYLDKMADFFGLATYQLFQPGISPLTERRKRAERRSGHDRRISRVAEMLAPTPSWAEVESAMRKLSPDEYRKFVRRAFGALALIDEPRPGSGPTDQEPPSEPPAAPAGHTRPRHR